MLCWWEIWILLIEWAGQSEVKRSWRFSGVLLTKPFPNKSLSSGNSDLDSKGVKFCFLESSWCNYLEDRRERRVPLGCEVWKLNCKEVPSISVKIFRVWELVSLVAVLRMLTAPQVRHASVGRDFTIPLGVYSCCFKAHNQELASPSLRHGHKGKNKSAFETFSTLLLRKRSPFKHQRIPAWDAILLLSMLANVWSASLKMLENALIKGPVSWYVLRITYIPSETLCQFFRY